MEASKSWLKDSFNTTGRWNRKKFILLQVTIFVLVMVLVFIGTFVFMSAAASATPDSTSAGVGIVIVIGVILLIAATYVSIVSHMKRLRDMNHSPWLSIISLIPYISIVMLIYCACKKGTVGDNQYGPDPLGGVASVDDPKSGTDEL